MKIESSASRTPDIVVSYDFDESAVVQGLPGIEFESAQNNRGMHGSFSPIDVHNTLIATGPDFRAGFVDTLPSGNVDVAPTIAWLFGLPLPGADGRPLYEALTAGELSSNDFTITPAVVPSTTVTGLQMKLPTSPSGADVDATKTSYHIELHTKTAAFCGQNETYFDFAKAVRQ